MQYSEGAQLDVPQVIRGAGGGADAALDDADASGGDGDGGGAVFNEAGDGDAEPADVVACVALSATRASWEKLRRWTEAITDGPRSHASTWAPAPFQQRMCR